MPQTQKEAQKVPKKRNQHNSVRRLTSLMSCPSQKSRTRLSLTMARSKPRRRGLWSIDSDSALLWSSKRTLESTRRVSMWNDRSTMSLTSNSFKLKRKLLSLNASKKHCKRFLMSVWQLLSRLKALQLAWKRKETSRSRRYKSYKARSLIKLPRSKIWMMNLREAKSRSMSCPLRKDG